MSWTSSARVSTSSPYFAASGASVEASRAVAATLSPRSSAASAQILPKPFELPVMNQTFESAIRPPGSSCDWFSDPVRRPTSALGLLGGADRQPRALLDRDALRPRAGRAD